MGRRTLRHSGRSVIFIDDLGWDSFDQVAAGLRRRGFRTIRLAIDEPPGPPPPFRATQLRWLADRLFYDEVLVWGRPTSEQRLRDLLGRDEVADVVSAEPSIFRMGLDHPLVLALADVALCFNRTPPSILLDKFAVNARLGEAGVGVPRQIRAERLSPAAAAERLGLPMVIKHPVGAAGEGVRIAGSVAEIEAALQALGGDRTQLFYQQHIRGEMMTYAVVQGPEGPLEERGFIKPSTQYPLGPSASIQLYDDERLLGEGRRAVAALGCQGPSSFGFIRDQAGVLWHIDANCRVWGSILAGLQIDIDFVGAYAALLRGERDWRKPAPMAGMESRSLPIYPFTLYDAAAHGDFAQILRALGQGLRVGLAGAGSAYCALMLLKALIALVRRIQRGGRPVPQADESGLSTAALPL